MSDPNSVHSANNASLDAPIVVSALFPNRECAEKAHDALVRRGFAEREISVAMRQEGDPARPTPPLDKSDTGDKVAAKAAENSAKGAAIGGTAGALIGVLAAASSVVIPGIGIILAGPIAAGIAGLAAGGVAGGVAGALVGSGVPEEDARIMESDLEEGRILIAVRARSPQEVREIRDEWTSFNAQRIHEHSVPPGGEAV
jgi:hypothetical protein